MPDVIFITRNGERYGPYTQSQCEHMIAAGQIVSTDLAWRSGMQDWRPLGEIIPNRFQLSSVPIVQVLPQAETPAVVQDETAGEILGKMGCGCLLWIGLLALALGGGVVFPVLLIILPIAVIGGIVDMVQKLSKLSKQRKQNRQF
jgi:uncharacterized integral membrane protein